MTRTIAILTIMGLLIAACGSDASDSAPDTTTPLSAPSTSPTTTAGSTDDAVGSGTIAVHIEDVEGFFIEGFEVGLRFETSDGDVIASTLWTDYVAAQGDGTLESFYDTVLEQPVPTGDIVVFASANIGAGPAPEIPDVEGDLRCRLDLTLADGERIDIEVTFADTDNCLVIR